MADRDGGAVIAANNVYRIARYKWHSLHDVTLPLGSPVCSSHFSLCHPSHPALMFPMILGKSLENVLQIEFHSWLSFFPFFFLILHRLSSIETIFSDCSKRLYVTEENGQTC